MLPVGLAQVLSGVRNAGKHGSMLPAHTACFWRLMLTAIKVDVALLAALIRRYSWRRGHAYLWIDGHLASS